MKLWLCGFCILFLTGIVCGGLTADSQIIKTKDGLTLYKPLISPEVYDKNIYLNNLCVSSNGRGEVGNSESGSADITTAGDKAVFNSWSTNLDGNIKGSGIFFKDIKSGNVRLLSDMGLGAAISEDGLWIAYEYSPDPDHGVLPVLMLYNVETGKAQEIMATSGGNKAGWYMPDTRIEKGIVYFHSTKTGKLQEYQYNIKEVKLI